MTTPTRFPFAERFKAPQGEGLYAGTMMAFARTVGCSVGQTICTACDTDFDRMRPDLGGGLYTPKEIAEWAGDCAHVCLTGGEPLDRDIRPILFDVAPRLVHIETSGTKKPWWLDPLWHEGSIRPAGVHAIGIEEEHRRTVWSELPLWVCVSPKPGYLEEMVVDIADEVKVIIGGLGEGPGWPSIEDALRWASIGKLVYVQPRNHRTTIDRTALDEALNVVAHHPQLRLSPQLHKFIGTR